MSGNMRHSELTFRLSCWGLGLIAFGQLLIGGVAVAVRVEKAREVRTVEKVVTKIVTVAAEPARPVVAVAPNRLATTPAAAPL